MVPVGPGTLGRIMNVTGDPIDERGPIKATKRLPIHADAPTFVEQATSADVLITGIKVVDLLAPYARGGKIGLFGGAGVGKTVFIQELIVRLHGLNKPDSVDGHANSSGRIILPKLTVVTQSSQVSASGPEKVTTYTTKCRRHKSFSSMVNPRSH